jgi:lysophospholipase L1-like esterase
MSGSDNKFMNLNRILLLSWLCCFIIAVPWPASAAETKHNYAQWNREIGAFVASDRTNPPPLHGVLFIGSSTIRFWTTLAADFPGVPVINRGFGGSEIKDSTYFADKILFPYAPKAIFFRAGGNDIADGEAPEDVFRDFQEFVTTVHARLPDTDIYFISWSSTPSRWQNRDKEATLNRLVKAYAEHTPHLFYIEADAFVLGPDGKPRPELYRADKLHFDAAGYKLLAARVRPYVMKYR